MSKLVTLAVLAATLVVGGCSGTNVPAQAKPAAFTIPTSARDGSPDFALMEGTLRLDDRGCLTIGKTTLEWPKGYTARRTSQGVEVRDAHGVVVARTGRKLVAGGGGTSTRTGPCLSTAAFVFEVGALPALTS